MNSTSKKKEKTKEQEESMDTGTGRHGCVEALHRKGIKEKGLSSSQHNLTPGKIKTNKLLR